jgi:tetratricopeptide (TPR) repeat protein
MTSARRAIEARLDDVRQGWRFAIADGDAAALERGLDGLVLVHELRGTIDAAHALVASAWEAAVGWGRVAPPGSATARLPVRLRVALARLAVGRARYDEAVAHAEAAITELEERARDAHPTGPDGIAEVLAVDALGVLGHALWRKGAYESADSVLEQAERRLDELGPTAPGWLRRGVRGTRGSVVRYLGRYEEARRYGGAVLRDAQADGDALAVARAHQSLGVFAHEAGDFAFAREAGEAALAAFRALGHRRGVGNALNNLANVYADVGDHGLSADALREALAIFRSLGDRWGEAMALNNLGMEVLDAGDPGDALGRFREAERLMREIANRQGEAMATNNLGIAWAALGEAARAREACAEALAVYVEIGDRRGVAMAHCDLSTMLLEQDAATATDHAQTALSIAREVGDRPTEARACDALAWARLAAGDPEAAVQDFERALDLRRALAQDEPALHALAGRAEARAAAGDVAGATADARALAQALAERELSAWGDPFTAALAIWRVLGQRDDGASADRLTAERVLRESRSLLELRAQRLADPVRRRGYLEGVTAHRALRAAGTP